MAFSNWRIGMHIQQDAIVLVALRYARSRWALCRWWDIELAPGIVRHGMVVDVVALAERLQNWRRELPLQHQVSIAFPASRTLQKQLPRPQLSLSDRERATWIASVMAQQLEMPAASLCVDYCAAPAKNEWRVTAAQRLDIDVLRQLAARLKLRIAGIVPDASALAAFLPWLPSGSQGLAWRHDPHWLWATREGWGSLPCAEASSFSQLSLLIDGQSLQHCATRSDDETSFDPWRVIDRLQPPLPDCGERYAVAIGLALGGAVTMTMAVNFLPWREARRRQRLRVTLLYAAGLLLILLTVAQVHRAERHAVEALAAVRVEAENQLSSALRQRENSMLERQQQVQRQRLRQQRRALTEAWQPRLRAIAAQLPEQAWLTRLEYQRDTLMLSGLALNLNAVAGLEKALNAVAGFKPARAGETRRGEQGRWQFRFSLSGEHADAGTH